MSDEKLIEVDCEWCYGDEDKTGCDACGGSGKRMLPVDLEERTEKQEELVSALYDFGKALGCSQPQIYKAIRPTIDRIMENFGVERVEIQ